MVARETRLNNTCWSRLQWHMHGELHS